MLEKKISEIILTPGITNISRVVRVFKAIEGDLAELSIVMDIPQEILAMELEIKAFEDKPKEKVQATTFKQYAEIFFDGYQEGSGIKWKPLAKDFAQLKNIMKHASLEQFEQIMKLYVNIKADLVAKRKVDFEMGNFARNVSPGYIVSKINLLLEKIHVAPAKKRNYEETRL